MKHLAAPDDERYASAFEACAIPAADFDHAAHVRLGYVYLCDAQGDVDAASRRMKRALLAFLAHLGIGDGKYHETMTRAWIMAIEHFMSRAPAPYASAAEFMAANPVLLDGKIMLTHYSAELLFSDQARREFAPPDRQSIPP